MLILERTLCVHLVAWCLPTHSCKLRYNITSEAKEASGPEIPRESHQSSCGDRERTVSIGSFARKPLNSHRATVESYCRTLGRLDWI